MLQRTQLMLDEQTKNDLLYLSMATNRSMSSLVREFVVEKVKIEKESYQSQAVFGRRSRNFIENGQKRRKAGPKISFERLVRSGNQS